MRTRDLELQKEMFLLVDQWKQGTKSQKQISEENGIKLTTFKYWRTTYAVIHDSSAKKEESSFHKIHKTNTEYKAKLNIELEYPNGVKLKLDNSNTELLKILINILS